ncbi:MAG: PAS domain-containing sensor histidine kinase [Alphaproteobacteria bacterium]
MRRDCLKALPAPYRLPGDERNPLICGSRSGGQEYYLEGAALMASWRNSIAFRYFLVSLIAAVVPMIVIGALYDRYSSGLVDTLTGERLERRLTAIAGRLTGFLNSRFYQLETLSGYPALASMVSPTGFESVDAGLMAVVQFEADQPDLYGILLFSNDGDLVRAIPGRAAAGPPYWGGGSFSLDGLDRITVPGGEVLGPIPPRSGRPASFLLIRPMYDKFNRSEPTGAIALHVRLASLTELMGAEDEVGLFRPLLVTASGALYSSVGIPEPTPLKLIRGAEILPGWSPAVAIDWKDLAAPLERVRYDLMIAIAVVVAVQIWLFLGLLRRVSGRIAMLITGADAVASGDLCWRIACEGDDEISTLARAFNGMAERLQQVVRSTVETEKMAVLGQFATGVAHEVRNPLAAMKTSVQALLAHERDEQRRAILEGMDEEVDQLDETLDDLLTYARPREPKIESVCAHDVFRRVTAMVEKNALVAGITIRCIDEQSVIVRADAGHIQQTLMNLVLNALQAMPQGGQILLKATHGNGLAAIEVSDTGVGMEPGVLNKITDPFFTTRPGGTGLGLAISRQLVEANLGELRFASKPGKGTTATIRLPAAEGGR